MAIPAALLLAGAQGLAGAGQALFSGKKRAEDDLEKFAKSYSGSPSILDSYNKALNRYSADPYKSQFFQNQKNLIQRNLATGLNATQTKRGGLATITGLTQGANDANARAGAQAEQQGAQQLSQVMQAGNAVAAETNKKFDMLYNLKAAKAGGANATRAAGWQNLFGAFGNAANYLSEDDDEEKSTPPMKANFRRI